ncbi:hypothetical protein [Leptospira sp. 'Mane']|uniref:hypothetical protein n=1 Tax=Leptospira sp. 'Mane' TaxID=3387407 RepID=UPI00398B0429
MKNKQINVSYNENVLYVFFGNFRRKQTYFFLCQWEATVLQTKIIKHGNFECYLEYLIDSYSQMIHCHFQDETKEMKTDFVKAGFYIRFRCNVYVETLRKLNELARYAKVSNTKMFRILLEMDRKGWKPPLRSAA